MRFFIPPLDTRLQLTKPWTFTLHNEHRNSSLVEALLTRTTTIAKEVWEKSIAERTLGERADSYYRKRYPGFCIIGPAVRELAEWQRRAGYKLRDDDVRERPYVSVEYERHEYPKQAEVTLPKGTELALDRIYIRRGAEGYDSATFRVVDCPDKKLAPKRAGGTLSRAPRFWAKLPEVNRIECKVIEELARAA